MESPTVTSQCDTWSVAARRHVGALAFAALLCGAGAAETGDGALLFADELIERVEAEGVLLLDSAAAGPEGQRRIEALVLFAQPPDRAFELLVQTSRLVEFQPDVSRARTLERSEHGNLDEQQLRILFVNIVYRIRHHWDLEAGRIWWSLDPDFDNDLRRLAGFWQLHPHGPDQTLAHYATTVDVGGALPGFLQDRLTRKNLPGAMERTRTWVDSGGTYRAD